MKPYNFFSKNPKSALVCAASKGLGRASAIALAEQGYSLVVCARTENTLQASAEAMREAGAASVTAVVADLTSEAGLQTLIGATWQAFSDGPDCLVLNTGGPSPSTASQTPLSAWPPGFQQLFMAPVTLVDAFLPALRKKGWGRIVAITSGSVLEPVPQLTVSNAMRSALTSYLKTLAGDIGADGITVNCVAPGFIHTDRIDQLAESQAAEGNSSKEAALDRFRSYIPLHRLGKPEELGALVAFLCSEQASYLTGLTIPVDGGKRFSLF